MSRNLFQAEVDDICIEKREYDKEYDKYTPTTILICNDYEGNKGDWLGESHRAATEIIIV